MTDLENQMEMIKQGTHPELLARIEEIEKRKKQRLEMIMAEKRFTVQLIEKDYKADEFVAHCEFNSEKRKFKKRKLEELEDLRCRIKTEKRRIDVLDEEEPLNESEKNEDLIALGIINEDDYAQGTHPELLARIEEIEKRKKQRLEMIMAEKRFTVQLIEKDYKADEFVAHCEFNSEKRKFKKRKLEELEDLRCRIKTEKRRIDVLDEEDYVIPNRERLVKRRRTKEIVASNCEFLYNNYGFPGNILF
ncbi:3994_t:CDS:2 [Entrophospora sp. SA101]|nr:3994_t:CDS:2 [Entrophospora sp. SA101]